MSDTLRVLQWNAARSIAAIHSLFPFLSSNPHPPDLILIQEPPWYRIGLTPSLTIPDGIDVLGVPTISGYIPCLPPDTRPRVLTYVSRNLPPASWSVVGAASHGTDVLTIEVHYSVTIRVCNYYGMHDPDRSTMTTRYPGESFVFSLSPTLASSLTVAGDFNCRHHSWSELPCTREESNRASALDDFFREHGLSPAHLPDSDSHPKKGRPARCPIYYQHILGT